MRLLLLPTLLALLVALPAAHVPASSKPTPSHIFANYIGVINRANSSFSLVNPVTLVPTTVPLPSGSEPMYFVCLFRNIPNRPTELWVGDRANNRLVIFLLRRSNVVLDAFLPTPAGLFHSMVTQKLSSRRPLAFTTCDIARVTVVHNLRTRKHLCTMHMPQVVAALGAKPHDVTADAKYAFVTYIGATDGFGYVASYVAETCAFITFIQTARDPHVAVRPGTSLWIAAQGGDVLARTVPQMAPLTMDTTQMSPHGTFLSYNKRFLYVTNIADGGQNAVVVYNQRRRRLKNCPNINTTFPVPHNPIASFDNSKLYISHSVPDNNVNSQWDIGNDGCLIPGTEVIFNTGLNPFGIDVVPPPRFDRLRRLVMSSRRK